MFNEYEVSQMIKFRQEEIERKAKDAWKYYVNPPERKKSEGKTLTTESTSYPCCPCPCV